MHTPLVASNLSEFTISIRYTPLQTTVNKCSIHEQRTCGVPLVGDTYSIRIGVETENTSGLEDKDVTLKR